MSDVSEFPFKRPLKKGDHAFGPIHYVKATRDGLPAQVERACVCGVVKITVFGSNGASAWREWRLPGDPVQYSDAIGPPRCTSTGGQG